MQRDKDLWLSDGDLIIRAENFSFRIYSKALAANSTVFADMLPFSPPVGDATDNEMMDGLPVVHLFDSAAGATLLLKAIFDATPPRRARHFAHALYPTSLPQLPDVPHQLHPGGLLADHCVVLAAALVVDARWLLPSLYYEISCYPIRDILAAGAAWDDLPLSTRRQILATHGGRLDRLRLVNWFKFDEVHGCDWREGCPYNSMSSAGQFLAFIARDGTMDPLRYWTEEAKTKFRDTRCGKCLDGFEKLIEEGREEIWKGLPAAAGFTGWPEVQTMRQVVMGT
ncbi:hypothetical protein C8J57DRAFT_1461730 [Mycena rebaudengoi]|nr:hypothetical protein C8J57DRAFT_1461730 [Mycena rebaudengoi]